MVFDPSSTTTQALQSAQTTRQVQSHTTSIAVQTQATSTEIIEEDKRLIDEIREKGFSQFVAELKEQKLEDLREKILTAMGLNEGALDNMPADQRAEIEKLIQREIVQRMAANAEMNGHSTTIYSHTTEVKIHHSELNVSATIASNMGLGPLLALQESTELAQQYLPRDEGNDG